MLTARWRSLIICLPWNPKFLDELRLRYLTSNRTPKSKTCCQHSRTWRSIQVRNFKFHNLPNRSNNNLNKFNKHLVHLCAKLTKVRTQITKLSSRSKPGSPQVICPYKHLLFLISPNPWTKHSITQHPKTHQAISATKRVETWNPKSLTRKPHKWWKNYKKISRISNRRLTLPYPSWFNKRMISKLGQFHPT